MKPLVTIAIPTWNRADVLLRAIASALAQTWRPLRVVVVDNASDDGTAEVVARFAAPELVYVRNERNLGMQGNFNRCAELAEGKYFKVLCSDDVAYPTLVERQVEVLERHPDVVAVTARRRRLTPNPLFRAYDPLLAMRAGRWRGGDAVRRTFLVGNLIGGPVQVLVRLDAWRRVGPFRADPTVGGMFDIEPVLRLLADGHDLWVLDEVLCEFDSGDASFTTRHLVNPDALGFHFAFRDELAREPLFARHLRPEDVAHARRNAAWLLAVAGASVVIPSRDDVAAHRLYPWLREHHRGRVFRWFTKLLERAA